MRPQTKRCFQLALIEAQWIFLYLSVGVYVNSSLSCKSDETQKCFTDENFLFIYFMKRTASLADDYGPKIGDSVKNTSRTVTCLSSIRIWLSYYLELK